MFAPLDAALPPAGEIPVDTALRTLTLAILDSLYANCWESTGGSRSVRESTAEPSLSMIVVRGFEGATISSPVAGRARRSGYLTEKAESVVHGLSGHPEAWAAARGDGG